MQMNPSIILAGQQPDMMGQFGRGMQMAQTQRDNQHTNAFRAMLQENGAGIMGGQQNALAALAQYDPQAALGVQQTRQNMAAQQEQLQMARAAAARSAASHAAQMNAADRAREAETWGRGVSMLTQAQTPEQFNAIMQMPGVMQAAESLFGPGMATFENRDLLIAGAMGVSDALQLGQGGGELPAAAQTLAWRAREGGLVRGTPEYQTFIRGNGGDGQRSAREDQISRLIETGIDRTTAIGIVDGRLRVSRDPITGEAVIVDMAQAPMATQARSQPESAPQGPRIDAPANQARPDAEPAFGLTGAAQNFANTIGDVSGLGRPYAETGDTISDFRVLREQVLGDIADSYARQPPSWLLQRIDELTPNPASLRQGPEAAQSQLRALRDMFVSEMNTATRRLSARAMSPTRRQELEGTVTGLEAAISRVDGALSRFGGGRQQNRTSSGVTWSVEP